MNGMMGSMNIIDIGLLIVLIATFIWMAYSVLFDRPEETENEKMLRERAAKKTLNKGPAAWPFPKASDIQPTKSKPKRAKNDKGHYKKDDPATPQNEAWVGGKTPDKPKNTKKKSTTTKKSNTAKKNPTSTTKKRKPKAKKETS